MSTASGNSPGRTPLASFWDGDNLSMAFVALNHLLCRTTAAFLLILATSASASARQLSSTAAVTMDASITIVENTQESGPVRRATEDLRSDFNRVFGQTPKLVNNLEEGGPLSILISERASLPAGSNCATATGAEAFAFSIVSLPGRRGSKRVVCLVGADMRGTIFAIYQFSQTYLGTDPMYLWTAKQPQKCSSISLPADFAKIFPKPVFHYRGFFTNDE